MPSGGNKRGNPPMVMPPRHSDRSPPASPPSATASSRFERSRAALEQLVNEDRSRREAMRRGRADSGEDFQSRMSYANNAIESRLRLSN